jgi:hypothetical protein
MILQTKSNAHAVHYKRMFLGTSSSVMFIHTVQKTTMREIILTTKDRLTVSKTGWEFVDTLHLISVLSHKWVPYCGWSGQQNSWYSQQFPLCHQSRPTPGLTYVTTITKFLTLSNDKPGCQLPWELISFQELHLAIDLPQQLRPAASSCIQHSRKQFAAEIIAHR